MQQLALAGSWQNIRAWWVSSWKLFWPSLLKSISDLSFHQALKWTFPFAGFKFHGKTPLWTHLEVFSRSRSNLGVAEILWALLPLHKNSTKILIHLFPTIHWLHSGNKILFQALYGISQNLWVKIQSWCKLISTAACADLFQHRFILMILT